MPRQYRESGVVQCAGHAGPDEDPAEVKLVQGLDAAQEGERGTCGDGSTDEHDARMTTIDRDVDRRPERGHGKQGEAECGGHFDARCAQLSFHRYDEQREGIVQRTPGDELGRRKQSQE